jgi:hypothetical protein
MRLMTAAALLLLARPTKAKRRLSVKCENEHEKPRKALPWAIERSARRSKLIVALGAVHQAGAQEK